MKLLQHVVFVVSHSSRYECRRTGLNLVERTRRDAVLVVWWLTTETWIVCKQWPFWCYWLEALKKVKAHWDYVEIVQKGNGKRILLKTFMKISVRETKTMIKILTPSYCPITKASNNSHFHSSNFFALYFPSQCQWFLSLFVTFCHLRN